MLNQTNSNHYLKHLAEINQTNKVLFSEDVYNHKGVLVAKKNTEMSRRNFEIIARHKLIKPVEQSISLQHSLSKQISLDFFKNRVDKLRLSSIMHHSRLFREQKSPFGVLSKYTLVDQKLTVMCDRLPEVFDRTLLTSVIAIGISRELGFDEARVEQVLIASLISDVGLLHLPLELVTKKERYTITEWKMMQGHTAIAKHFADAVSYSSNIIGRAVLEHHERPDGFGYPFGRQHSQLCIEGQILAMAETVTALYRKWVVNGNCSWNSVSAIIHVPSSAHIDEVRQATLRLLKRLNIPFKNTYENDQFAPLIERLKEKFHRLKNWFQVLSDILELHRVELAESNSFRPYMLLKQLEDTLAVSGLLDSAQLDWLTYLCLPPSDADRLDIEEYELKLSEIEYQCFFVMRKLKDDSEELARRFKSEALAEHYTDELIGILKGDI